MPTLSDILPAQTGAPSGQLRAPFSDQAQQLLTELQVRAGQRFEATVIRLSEVATGERQTLIQSMADRAAPMTPRAQQALTQLLSSPALNLVKLQAQGQVVHTLTDLQLIKGQTVTLQVRPDGQLQLMPTPHATAPPPNQSPSNADTRGQPPTIPATTTPPDVRVGGKAAPVPASSAPNLSSMNSVHEALRGALRQALPLAQPSSALLNHLTHLPPATLTSPNTPALSNFLTPLMQLAQQVAPAEQWQRDPVGTLKQAINNSGIFFEHKLREASTPGRDRPEQDPKALLTQALQLPITQTLAQLLSAPAPGAALNQFEQAIARLFGGAAAQQNAANQQHLAHDLPKLVQGALAQIQLQQYRTLGTMSPDAAATPLQLYLDMPLRTPEGFWNLFLHFQELREKDPKPEREKKTTRRKSRWQVYMELEMGDEGRLAMEINLLDQRVDARFWAERSALRQKTAAGLTQLKQKLEAQGLEVTDLRCSGQAPPRQKMNLNYSLVDERT